MPDEIDEGALEAKIEKLLDGYVDDWRDHVSSMPGALVSLFKGHRAYEAAKAGDAGAIDAMDFQLLFKLKQDNVHTNRERPMVCNGARMDQAMRLSAEGFIALEQLAGGCRLHITRKGSKAVTAFMEAAGYAKGDA